MPKRTKPRSKYGLQTVAVPGSGLDWNVLYPKANHGLAREILAAGGALLSEEKPETGAADWTFPKRNRIMVGLSHATLVVEAKEKSGSLITAKLATEYNRDLLVVPGSIFSECRKARINSCGSARKQPLRLPTFCKRSALPSVTSAALELRTDLSESEVRVLDLIASPLSRDELIRALKCQ